MKLKVMKLQQIKIWFILFMLLFFKPEITKTKTINIYYYLNKELFIKEYVLFEHSDCVKNRKIIYPSKDDTLRNKFLGNYNDFYSVFKKENSPLDPNVFYKVQYKIWKMYHKFIPAKFVLAQAKLESNYGKLGRSPECNPFNVWEFDNGTKKEFYSQYDGIYEYYRILCTQYLVNGKTIDDLRVEFVNFRDKRYASNINYENLLNKIIESYNINS